MAAFTSFHTGFSSYSVDNDKRFREALARAAAQVSDLRIPLGLIQFDFYKSQKAIWKLSGPGQYPDLANSTKSDKGRRGFPIYPILKRTGVLEAAASDADGAGAFHRIEDKQALVIGIEDAVVPYAGYHQGTKGKNIHNPLRKFFFIGPEAPRFATSEQAGRVNRWTNILSAYVLQATSPIGDAA